jgi:hypothetical protein
MEKKLSPLGISDRQVDVFYSTIVYDGGDVVTDVAFFPNTGYGEQYQNLNFPTPSDQDIYIHGMRIDSVLRFAVGSDTGKEREYQQFFENFARLTWKHGKKGYATLPMHLLQPYDAFTSNATATNRTKFSDFLPLKTPIYVPANSRFEIKLLVPKQLTLHTTGLAYLPDAPSGLLAGTLGYYIKLSMWCESVDPVK